MHAAGDIARQDSAEMHHSAQDLSSWGAAAVYFLTGRFAGQKEFLLNEHKKSPAPGRVRGLMHYHMVPGSKNSSSTCC